MTTPLKALCLAHMALVIGLLAHSNIVSAQTPIAFGEIVQANFTANHQMHEYTVTMTAGDRLRIQVESVGQTLRTDVRVLDPGGNRVEYWRPDFTHDRQSRQFSANGAYLIQVRNSRGVGVYNISVGRIDRGGNETLPGSRGSGGSP